MKLLLLGATGRTGKIVLRKALANGHEVNCLSRNAKRIKAQQGLTLFEGNPINRTDLEKAIQGCNAVISVLNISRRSDFPWDKLRTPNRYLSEVMHLLISLVENSEMNRLIVCSAWGVAETKNDIPKWFKWFIENSNIGIAYKDHERQEKILINSTLNWTIVRPVGLTNSNKQENVRETFNNEPKPNLIISRQSVANYIVNSLSKDDLFRKKVVISKE